MWIRIGIVGCFPLCILCYLPQGLFFFLQAYGTEGSFSCSRPKWIIQHNIDRVIYGALVSASIHPIIAHRCGWLQAWSWPIVLGLSEPGLIALGMKFLPFLKSGWLLPKIEPLPGWLPAEDLFHLTDQRFSRRKKPTDWARTPLLSAFCFTPFAPIRLYNLDRDVTSVIWPSWKVLDSQKHRQTTSSLEYLVTSSTWTIQRCFRIRNYNASPGKDNYNSTNLFSFQKTVVIFVSGLQTVFSRMNWLRDLS